MQKKINVWLIAAYFLVTCLLSEAMAASNLPRSPWLVKEAWMTDQPLELSENSRQLIRAIRNASVHGLNPDSYGLAEIMVTIEALSETGSAVLPGERVQGPATGQSDAQVSKSLSNQMDRAFTHLATHLGQGVVDARSTQLELFRDAPTVNTADLLESVRKGQQNAMQALESVTPTHSEYQRLTGRMRNLLTERAAGIERPVIRTYTNLTESMNHPDVMVVKHRLMDTGELPPDTALTPAFDGELKAALRRFQQRNGLEPDGDVGSRTRRALNLSIDDEIRAVALSLERWRWMPRELGQKHLYINIPDYRVEFREAMETRMTMVAVVGAKDHQTPAFTRDMSYIEFNPTWTVPSTITNEELIPREREQPGYLASRQFDFLAYVDGQLEVVSPSMVTAEVLQSEPFPYTLRQRSGPMNDLGRMKFMMPNPYAIYLHDTQAKKHFFLNERAYSHGCIRLSDPNGMATLLMTEDGYSPADISRALKNPDTHRVQLRAPIPTHLTYMTTWVDASGSLQRRADIYQHDTILLNALQAAGTLLSTLNQATASLEPQSLPIRGQI